VQGNESDLMQAFSMLCAQMYVSPQAPFVFNMDVPDSHAISLSCNLVAACLYFAYKGDVDGCLGLSEWATMFLHVFVWLTSGFESTRIEPGQSILTGTEPKRPMTPVSAPV
jgi:hypothetical protein